MTPSHFRLASPSARTHLVRATRIDAEYLRCSEKLAEDSKQQQATAGQHGKRTMHARATNKKDQTRRNHAQSAAELPAEQAAAATGTTVPRDNSLRAPTQSQYARGNPLTALLEGWGQNATHAEEALVVSSENTLSRTQSTGTDDQFKNEIDIQDKMNPEPAAELDQKIDTKLPQQKENVAQPPENIPEKLTKLNFQDQNDKNLISSRKDQPSVKSGIQESCQVRNEPATLSPKMGERVQEKPPTLVYKDELVGRSVEDGSHASRDDPDNKIGHTTDNGLKLILQGCNFKETPLGGDKFIKATSEAAIDGTTPSPPPTEVNSGAEEDDNIMTATSSPRVKDWDKLKQLQEEAEICELTQGLQPHQVNSNYTERHQKFLRGLRLKYYERKMRPAPSRQGLEDLLGPTPRVDNDVGMRTREPEIVVTGKPVETVVTSQGCLPDSKSTGTVVTSQGCLPDSKSTKTVVTSQGCLPNSKTTEMVVTSQGCLPDSKTIETVVTSQGCLPDSKTTETAVTSQGCLPDSKTTETAVTSQGCLPDSKTTETVVTSQGCLPDSKTTDTEEMHAYAVTTVKSKKQGAREHRQDAKARSDHNKMVTRKKFAKTADAKLIAAKAVAKAAHAEVSKTLGQCERGRTRHNSRKKSRPKGKASKRPRAQSLPRTSNQQKDEQRKAQAEYWELVTQAETKLRARFKAVTNDVPSKHPQCHRARSKTKK